MAPSMLDARLLNDYQRRFPLTSRPFARLAGELDASEADVLTRFAALQADGRISRIGAVVRPQTVGASTLAAMAVAPDRIDHVAELVAARPEVNHCYEREHHYNLWFVVTAADRSAVDTVLAEIEAKTGLAILNLPIEEAYHIDLGFAL